MNISIIQARTGASRLPGKVMLNIGTKPILWWVIERTKRSSLIDKVIVATTDKTQDDIIESLCKRLKVGCFRGSEDDVLDRYYKAGKKYKADTIVRITSDCPFVDPEIIDDITRIHFSHKNDCTMNDTDTSYPRGLDVEIFNFRTLEKVYLNAKRDYEREHVSPYIYEHLDIFKVERIKAVGILRRPGYRFCIDTKDDLKLVRKIYSMLKRSKKSITAHNIIGLLDFHPELVALNAHIRQKKLGE